MSETLIPFKVVYLVLHTLLPAVLPLLETFLESFLSNHVQPSCCVPHNVFIWLKLGPFQWHFQFGEEPKITRGHVGIVGSLTNQGNVVFSQKTLNQMRRMGGCIVVMELPSFCCPQVRSFAPHSIMKATKYPLVVLFGDGLALWRIFKMHHPTGVEKNGQHNFDVAADLPCLLWPRGWWMFPLWGLHLCFWVTPVNPRLITSDHGVQKVGITFYAVQHVLCDFQAKLLLLHH